MNKAIRVFSLVGLLSVALTAAFGQTQTATARGTVTDASGAVIPGASLTLTNIDQNRPWQSESNASGAYIFQQIPPGNYSLAVEAQGFKRYERRSFVLQVAQVAGIDVPLEIGEITETVEISAEAPLLATETSDLGEVVNSRTAESLPLNGRNVLQLIGLTPGINTTRNFRNSSNGNGSISAVAFSANGGRNVANSIMLDGSTQEVMGFNQPSYIRSPDTLQEFKVQTNAFSAQYGRTAGAVVNMVTRSGGSKFHGVLCEFLRNDKLQANNWFANANGNDRPAFRFNQFGGTLGGPLTPSRQRLFFFQSVEFRRQVNPASVTQSVPTAKMKRGDFSEDTRTIVRPAHAEGERHTGSLPEQHGCGGPPQSHSDRAALVLPRTNRAWNPQQLLLAARLPAEHVGHLVKGGLPDQRPQQPVRPRLAEQDDQHAAEPLEQRRLPGFGLERRDQPVVHPG